MNTPLNRRQFISRGSMVAAAVALTNGPLGRMGFSQNNEGDAVIPFLDRQGGVPNGAYVRWEELTDWITPKSNFFDVSHYTRQNVSAEGWKLSVEGLVDKPVSLSLEQIRERPKKEITATLECSGNGSNPGFMGAIGNAIWTGTPLAPLLNECGVSQDAIEVAFWGVDKGKEKIRGADYEQNFARCLSMADAMRDEVILAYEMNGQPLSAGHGFPLRLVVPGWYGIAWVKWLSRIELRDRRLMNRFMGRDYVTLRGIPHGDQTEWKESSVGPMNGKSIVARVVKRADGSYLVSGAAWNDGTPLKAVELKIDEGKWISTALERRQSAKYSWTFWTYMWKDPQPGEHVLVSRTVDGKGRTQPTAEDPEIAMKKTYWEAYAQYPRRIRI